jgi:hypothetical protein
MKGLLFAGLLSAGLLSASGDVSGDWTIVGDVQGVGVSDACTLTQTDAKLAGTCTMAGKKYDTTGTVDEKKIVLKHAGEYNAEPLTLTYTGVIGEDGNFSGVILVDPMGVDGTFTAKKAVAAK